MTISFKLHTFIWCLLLLFGDSSGTTDGDDDSKNDPSPIVSISYGNVRGEWKNDAAVFLGIPYAKPPVKDLQFKKPQNTNSWNETYSAKNYGAKCLSLPTVDKEGASEDCLYLNVFTINTKPQTLLPVLVFIHGGNYESGSSEDLSERGILRNLVSKGLVVVTFNYRLNFYGFFTTMTEEFPPNLGLWDQLQALKWVRNEIHNFGGDPYKITLAGHGYGASSVSLHLRSPHSSGLFKRAIMQSGSAFCPFAVAGNRYKIESSKIVAVSLHCCTETEFNEKQFTPDAIRCLKTVDQGKVWQTLLMNFSTGANHDNVYQSTWAAVIDDNFLPKSMTIVAKDAEILIGSTANEKGIAEISSMINNNGVNPANSSKNIFDLAVANLARPEAFPKSFRVVNDLLWFVYGFDTKNQWPDMQIGWLDKKLKYLIIRIDNQS